ncbi:MAG: hypothetical protein NTZ33_02500 [Bacteroidetes bacterium]|nr:hypothetical protein [Bacteroidota bacterium]
MKKNSILIFIVTIITVNSFLILSCKKNNDTTTPITNGNNNNSIICNGNGKNTYFPLDSGNIWNYNYYMLDVIQNQKPSLVHYGFANPTSLHTYAMLKDDSGWMYSGSYEYFREDPLTHDIYNYYSIYSGSGEYLFVPGSPYINQTWTGQSSTDVWTVTNLSASLVTPACSYTGLLEITNLNPGNITHKYYYKKGLGMVGLLSNGFPSTAYKLTSAKIKL